jgi:YD repeat-containing protein
MTKHFSTFVLVAAFLMPAVTTFAQLREQSLLNSDKVSIPSPNVASLGLYGQIPVSTFTGVPQIEVPLYTFQEGPLSIPLKMTYHAGGFRPDEHPSWVGLNWALNASSWSIARKVNGKADDYDTHDNEQTSGRENPFDPYSSRSGYYYNRAFLNASQWDQQTYLKSLTWTSSGNLDIIGTRKDTEPDEFSFSFPNGSGKFFMDMDGTWKVDCNRAVKVTFDGTFIPVPFTPSQGNLLTGFGYHKTFSGFTITDTDGTRYVYGSSANYIEYSIDFTEQAKDFWQADAWFLKEIVEPSGKKITFEYERAGFINQVVMSLSQNFGTGGSGSGMNQPPCGISSGSFFEDYTGRLIYPVYLKKIVGKTGYIQFNRALSSELDFGRDGTNIASIARDLYRVMWWHFYPVNTNRSDKMFPALLDYFETLNVGVEPPANFRTMDYVYFLVTLMQWHKLDNIEIYNTHRMYKRFKFDYDDGYNQRLMLRSIKEGSGGENYNPPYSFFYNSMDEVPYLSGKIDHWGFYNGVLSNISALQTPSVYHNSRSANPDFSVQGMLSQINYPTGGWASFEYEGNKASKIVPLDRAAALESYSGYTGGVRIRRIVTGNNVSEASAKEYFYVNGYKNSLNPNLRPVSGVVGGKALYLFNNFKVPADNSGSVYYIKNQFNSMSQLPASSNGQGSHIGYSEVVEKESNNSYTIYYYTNFDNGYKDEVSPNTNLAFSPYGPYTSLTRERGQLWKVEKYNAADVLVYRKETTYVAVNKANQFAKAIRARKYVICPGTNDYYAEATAYKNYTYAFLPLKETETTFDVNGGNGITSVKDYTYTNTNLTKSELFTNSNGQVRKYLSYYPNDFTAAPYPSMVLANVIAPIIKQEFLVDNVIQDVYQTEYTNSLSPNSSLYLPSYISTQHLTDAPEVRLRFLKYDDRGNILSYSKERDRPLCYVWGYGKNYPVGEIKNADYSVVEDVLGGAANIDEKGNMVDIPNVLPMTDATLTTFMAPLRTDPGLKNSLITTFTYDPQVGMTSSTDTNGKTTSYGFDAFGRLQTVKDFQQNILKMYSYYYIVR